MSQGAAEIAQQLRTLLLFQREPSFNPKLPQPFLTPVPGDMTGMNVKYRHERRQNIHTREVK